MPPRHTCAAFLPMWRVSAARRRHWRSTRSPCARRACAVHSRQSWAALRSLLDKKPMCSNACRCRILPTRIAALRVRSRRDLDTLDAPRQCARPRAQSRPSARWHARYATRSTAACARHSSKSRACTPRRQWPIACLAFRSRSSWLSSSLVHSEKAVRRRAFFETPRSEAATRAIANHSRIRASAAIRWVRREWRMASRPAVSARTTALREMDHAAKPVRSESVRERPMSACAALRSRPSQTERSRHPSRAVRAASYRASSYSVSARLCIDHVEKARRSCSSAAKSVASTVDGGRRLDMRARKHHWTRARVACSTDLPASTCAAISTCL